MVEGRSKKDRNKEICKGIRVRRKMKERNRQEIIEGRSKQERKNSRNKQDTNKEKNNKE